MPTPQTPYDAVLHAARDVTAVGTALEAEMLGGALLGGVYAVAAAEGDRARAVREFVGRFLTHTARRRTGAARAIRSVFAALIPDAPGAGSVRPGADPPAWSAQLGRVVPVGTWASGDVYGDQTSYLAMFRYEDAEVGGGEHAVVALVDHNIGIVKNLFVSEPGPRVLDQVRHAAEADELVWFSEVDPATLRAQVDYHLAVTDRLTTLPDQGSLATDRALVGARLATLPATGDPPAPPSVDPAALGSEFLASAYAADLDRATPAAEDAVRYAVRLILDFAREAPDADPLRWSPAVVGLFLLDWVHRRAVLDADDVTTVPAVLHAWVDWCGERRQLPAVAVAATHEAISTMAAELAGRHQRGEHGSPAAAAVVRLLADGVDPEDPAAVQAWLAANPEPGEDAGNGAAPPIPRPR